MEKFNIKKIYTDKQAIMEMEYQYDKLITVESSTARCNRFFNMLALYERFPILKSIWEYIEDAYEEIMREVKKGNLVLKKYDDLMKEKKDWLYKTIQKEYDEAKEHPEYRHFLINKFPFIKI